MSDWAAAVERSLVYSNSSIHKSLPKGWRSFEEMKVEFKLADSRTRMILNRLVDAGEVEVKSFTILARNGITCCPANGYRLTPKTTKCKKK